MSHWFPVIAVFSPEQVEAWFEVGGYFVLFGLLFACGLGFPMPEDIPLLAAGYFISQDKMHWIHAGIVAWCGIIGGDCVLYYLGRRFGLEITRVKFIGKHLTKERILRAEELFAAWGTWVVAVGRLFAGIRGAMVVAAGVTKFNFFKFVIVDGLAALVSGGLFVYLGYWAGKTFGSVSEIRAKIKDYEHWVFLGIGLLIVGVVVYYWRRRKKHKPMLTDVALEKAAVKAIEKAQETPAKSSQPLS